MNKWTFLVIIALGIMGCKSTETTKTLTCPDATLVTLTNLTGLGSCSWVLTLSNGERLEPINLSNYPIELVDGKEVYVTYTNADSMSACMVGDIVNISCLTEKL